MTGDSELLQTASEASDSQSDDLARELREALDRQVATNQILNLISQTPDDTQPVFDAIVESGSKLFPGATIAIGLPVEGNIEAVAVADEDSIRADLWRRRFPVPITRDYMHGEAILGGRVVDIPDVADANNTDTAGGQNFLAGGFRAITLMPMLHDDEAIGVLGVVRMEPGPLSNEQITLLRAFAAQAVIAIENTRMVNELRQTNVMVANISRQLSKYISPQLYNSIVAGDQDVAIDAKRKKLTIFFSDIVGFTEITDQLESEELTTLLNAYLSAMSGIAQAHGATFDKFIGDAIMCFFGDPESKGVKADAEACVRMALEMQEQLHVMQTGWRRQGVIDRPFQARMGINTGYCTVGNFGSQDRMDYTIIGHEVNLAARLESHADPGGILMAAETYSLVEEWLLAVEQDAITMKGFAQPVRIFQVSGTMADLEDGGSLIRHEDDGVRITIDKETADKSKTIAALERALADLNSEISK